MKKIIFLLCICASMGFTTASENKTSDAMARPAIKKLERTYGYIEISAPQSYTITLQ